MDLQPIRGLTATIGAPALTGLSGAAKTISYTGNPLFWIDGAQHTGNTCSGGALETTDDTTGAAFVALQNGKCCMFVFTWNSDGTWHVSQGPIVNTADLTNNAAVLNFPSIPDDACPFAYVPIKHANATAFTFATSNWNATGVTVGTVVNCGMLPRQPVTAFA